jgi:hypothetical protein
MNTTSRLYTNNQKLQQSTLLVRGSALDYYQQEVDDPHYTTKTTRRGGRRRNAYRSQRNLPKFTVLPQKAVAAGGPNNTSAAASTSFLASSCAASAAAPKVIFTNKDTGVVVLSPSQPRDAVKIKSERLSYASAAKAAPKMLVSRQSRRWILWFLHSSVMVVTARKSTVKQQR